MAQGWKTLRGEWCVISVPGLYFLKLIALDGHEFEEARSRSTKACGERDEQRDCYESDEHFANRGWSDRYKRAIAPEVEAHAPSFHACLQRTN